MKIKIKEVKDLLIQILVSLEVSKEDAEILSDEYLEGELQGKHSHGLMAFPSLAKKLPLKNNSCKVVKKTHSYLFVNANNNLGGIVGRKYVDEAIKMAKAEGVAVVLIKDMLSWLRPGSIARHIASKKMIGFVVNSGGKPMIAPPGGYTPQVGTNPIGIGIPIEGDDMVVDMATSKRAWGEVKKALADNTGLPEDTYFDDEGNFTKDPKKAYSVIGAGDYKGFSLALFIEILSGSLVGMSMGHELLGGEYRTKTRGAMILVINPSFSTDFVEFESKNKKLLNQIKDSKKRQGTKTILIPGERGAENKRKNLENDYLEIGKDLWEKLNSFKK